MKRNRYENTWLQIKCVIVGIAWGLTIYAVRPDMTALLVGGAVTLTAAEIHGWG